MIIAAAIMSIRGSPVIEVLFVCSGNICRSPTAEGVFRRLVAEAGLSARIAADSAGTGGWHAGEAPDPRSQEAARRRGIDIGDLRARQVAVSDFHRFQHVLAMDEDNRRRLARLCPPGRQGRLGLLLDFAPGLGRREVPDPYYRGVDGFELALDLIEAGAAGLLDHLRRTHGL